MTKPAVDEIGGHGSKTVVRSAGTLSMPVARDRRAYLAGERLLGADAMGDANASDADAGTALARRG